VFPWLDDQDPVCLGPKAASTYAGDWPAALLFYSPGNKPGLCQGRGKEPADLFLYLL
jgi:hypothetical protein